MIKSILMNQTIYPLKKVSMLLLMGVTFLLPFELMAQCPEITIDEKYDHIPSAYCRSHNWDTMVSCKNSSLILNSTYFITAEKFNGTYLVEEIPYNPVDTTFHAGNLLNISNDDVWESSAIQFPFTFMYFGYPYTQAVVGSNGIVSFNNSYIGQYCVGAPTMRPL